MSFPPFLVARYGIYVAIAASALSTWLGYRAGATLDYCVLRGVFVFVVFAALGFAAEAVLTLGWSPSPPAAPRATAHSDREDES